MKRPALIGGVLLSVALAVYALLTHVGWVSEDYLRLSRSWAGGMGLLAASFLAVRYWPRRSRGLRTHLEDLFLMLTVLALTLVIAGTEIGRPLDRLTVVVVVDRSRSIDLVPDAKQLVDRQLELAQTSMRDGDRIAIVSFGASAATEQPARTKDEPSLSQRPSFSRDGTDLEAALRRALAEVPPDSAARIVLLSDGVPTRGDVMAGAHAALAAQIPIDTLTLEQGRVADVRVVSVRAPARADAGESIDLRVVTQSPEPTEVEVRVLLDGQLIRQGKVEIGKGEDVLRLREKLPEAGLHRYDVEVTAADKELDFTGEDNAGSTFVRVRGAAVALVLEGDAGKSKFVADALRAAEFRVDEAGPMGVPADIGAMLGYDLIVLSDIQAGLLSSNQLAALAAYVRDFGGGLLLMGGDRGMGPGGFGKTPIEEVSPVSFDLKQDERRASLAEVIGIDISGSMGAQVGGKTKLELANEAASRSAQLLGPRDRLGVEHVDMEVHWTVPVAPVDDMVAIDRAIRSMPVGGGGILVPITLSEAYDALAKEEVNLKHVLLFSDGDDADQVEAGKPLAAAAFANGITTSVIALGDGKDTGHLEQLAKMAGGRYYLIEDATRLPAIFAQETILAARSALHEDPFRVSLGTLGQPGAGIDFSTAPELGGYVTTIPKSRATVHLLGPEDDPILATWSVGVGRSAAFMSDLKDRWGSEWTSWPPAARLLGQTARDIVRRAEDERVRLETSAAGGRLAVRATVVGDDGRADSFRRLKAHVVGPGGFVREIALEPSSTGSYSADLPIDRPGTYVVVARDEVSGDAVGTSGAVLSAGEELRPTGSDPGLLQRLVDLTGGEPRLSLRDVFKARTVRRFAFQDITPLLTLTAAVALLLAVAARKLGMPEALLEGVAWLRARVGSRDRPPTRPSAETVQVLLAAKKNAGPTTAPKRPAPQAPQASTARALAEPPRVVTPERASAKATSEPTAAAPVQPPESPVQKPMQGPAATGRAPSTAELLLARKRAKK